MPFTDAPAAPKPASASGISMSMQISAKSKKVRFTISEEAQTKFFGQKIIQMTGKVMVGSGDDEGYAQIRLDDNSETEFKESARGSAFISVGHWSALPNDARPSAQCEVKSYSEGDDAVVTLKLPSWASPHGHGGKLDQGKPLPVQKTST